MLQKIFFIEKIEKESNSVNTVYSVMVLALCTVVDGHLSMYQVSFNSCIFSEICPGHHFNFKL